MRLHWSSTGEAQFETWHEEVLIMNFALLLVVGMFVLMLLVVMLIGAFIRRADAPRR